MLRRAIKRILGSGEGGASGDPILSDEELEKIGTAEDPLLDYEAALERNFEAMEAEQQGEIDWAIQLYEQSVAAGFVESHPYERLANLYEQKRDPVKARRALEAYVQLARSGRMPRGAQRSADRKLLSIEARAERYRETQGSG